MVEDHHRLVVAGHQRAGGTWLAGNRVGRTKGYPKGGRIAAGSLAKRLDTIGQASTG